MHAVTSTDEFDAWFAEQTPEVSVEILAELMLLQEFGPRLKRPHADTLNGSKFARMKELRVKTATAQIRIAFAFDPARQAVLLVAGDKQGVSEKRFYRQLVTRADALYEKHLEKING